jgi:hypothetical protein
MGETAKILKEQRNSLPLDGGSCEKLKYSPSSYPEGVKKLNLSRHPGEPRIKSGAGTGVREIGKALKTLDSGFRQE